MRPRSLLLGCILIAAIWLAGASSGIPRYGFCGSDPINVVVISQVQLPSGLAPGKILAEALLQQWDWFSPFPFEHSCGQDYSAVKSGWWFDRWHIRIKNFDSKLAYANVHYDYNLWKLWNHDSKHCEDAEELLRSELDGVKVCLGSSCYLVKYQGQKIFLNNALTGCRDGYASVYHILRA